jgi:hypothetical protein
VTVSESPLKAAKCNGVRSWRYMTSLGSGINQLYRRGRVCETTTSNVLRRFALVLINFCNALTKHPGLHTDRFGTALRIDRA